MVDKFSKYTILEPVFEEISAQDTAEILIRRVVAEFGVPAKVISERGPQFTATVWKEVLNTLGSNIALAATHHPQTDGQSERAIRTLIQLLRCYTNEYEHQWETYLPLFQFAINNALCEATESTPFRILTGRDPRSPITFVSAEDPKPTHQNTEEYARDIEAKLTSLRQFVADKQRLVAARIKERVDRTRRIITFALGDQVLLSTKSHPALQGNRKQQDIRVGPFTVKQRVGPNAYELQGLPPNVPPVQNITYITPFHLSPHRFRTRPQPLPNIPTIIDGQPEWHVEAVTDFKQTRRGERRYRIKWEGSAREQWLPEEEMFHCPRKIREYFTREGIPLPPEVSRFCVEAEAENTTEESGSENDEPSPPVESPD